MPRLLSVAGYSGEIFSASRYLFLAAPKFPFRNNLTPSLLSCSTCSFIFENLIKNIVFYIPCQTFCHFNNVEVGINHLYIVERHVERFALAVVNGEYDSELNIRPPGEGRQVVAPGFGNGGYPQIE